MGRKIPGRKHRGVRDIDKQHQDRYDKIKDKINAPPGDKNEQEIPKSLARLMELKRKVKTGEIPLKKQPSVKKPKKSVAVHFKPAHAGLERGAGPVYVQAAGETDRCFMQRVNKVVRDVLKETAFSERYKVNIKRNQKTGEVEKVETREKDPLELFVDQLKKDKKTAQGSKKKRKKAAAAAAAAEEKVSKSQKKLRKLKAKKELKSMDKVKDHREVQHERLQFGEVAHAPPTLVKPKRVAKTVGPARPGSKDLLLKNVLKGAHLKVKVPPIPTKDAPVKLKKSQTDAKVIDKTGKRKNLPAALRRQLDKQQSEIIQAYKDLKKKKYLK